MVKMRLFSSIVLFLAFQSTTLRPDNWPAWRGSNNKGAATSGQYPANLSDPENLVWKLPLPGKGCSTPIVWENQIIITGPKEAQDTVSAITWAGKVAWTESIGKERAGKHRNGSGSNPSCVTDGELIYAYFKSGNFAALTLKGKVMWKKNLMSYGKDTLFWDLALRRYSPKNTLSWLSCAKVILGLWRLINRPAK